MCNVSTADAKRTEIRWGMAWGVRVFGGVCFGVLVLVGGLLAFDGARPSDRVSGVVFLTLAPVAGWLFYWRPYVELSRQFVYVRNPLRSHLIRLEDVRDAATLTTGLGLEMSNGDRVVAWSLQQGLLLSMLSGETRATTARRTILEAAAAVREGRVPELTSTHVTPLLTQAQQAAPPAVRRKALNRQLWWATASLTVGVCLILLATYVIDGLAEKYDSDAWTNFSTVVGFTGVATALVGLIWLSLAFAARRATDAER